jgi:hypothetical protein
MIVETIMHTLNELEVINLQRKVFFYIFFKKEMEENSGWEENKLSLVDSSCRRGTPKFSEEKEN